MKSVQQLFVNSTNRIPLSTQAPITTQTPLFSRLSSFKPVLASPQLHSLQLQEAFLEAQLKEALIEQQKMNSLFLQIFKAEQGIERKKAKWHRRCADDIIIKYACKEKQCGRTYSSEASLARHTRLKHICVKVEPPQPYYELHPNPNLLVSSTSEDYDTDQAHLYPKT